jgi:hypothetical protein
MAQQSRLFVAPQIYSASHEEGRKQVQNSDRKDYNKGMLSSHERARIETSSNSNTNTAQMETQKPMIK